MATRLERRARIAVRRLRQLTLRAVWEWLREPLAIFAVVYFGATAVAQPFYVPSGSMQPTLAIGDLLLATKYHYGYNRYSFPFSSGPSPSRTLLARLPRQGDVIVFRRPNQTAQTMVKRVIGLPGDRIQMRAGRLWINGRQLPLRPDGQGQVEDGPGEAAPGGYFAAGRFIETLPNGRQHPVFKKMWGAFYDDTPDFVVPAGHIFVMGDNRDDSADSRVPPEENGVGMLPLANVVGRAELVLVSVDFVNARGVWEWPFRLRLGRILDQVR